MFPNVRLLIGAMIASVVVLSCGFGVFAAFRVNHEPLARLPSVTAPVQLVADEPAAASETIATEETFGSRFQFSLSEIGDEDAEDTASIAPAAVPPAAPAPSAAEPAERTALTDDEPNASSAPLSEADEKLPVPQDTHAPETGGDPVADGAARVAVAPATDQSPPAEEPAQANQEIEAVPVAAPETAAKPTAKAARRTARKVVKRQRVAVKTYRAHRSRAHAIARSRSTDQNAAFAQPVFQSAPPDTFSARPGNARRIARRTAARRTAVGGPFVRPQSD